MKSKVEYQFGYEISSYGDFKRYKIAYIKNGKEQVATVMNYSLDGGKNYKVIEDVHFPYNRLTEKEMNEMGEAVNNNEIRLYAEAYC